MTPAPDLRAIVESTRRRIRAAVVVAIVAAVGAAIPAALLVAWLLGAWTGWRAPSIAPLVLELVAALAAGGLAYHRSEEHTSELQSRENLVCRLLLEKKKKKDTQ